MTSDSVFRTSRVSANVARYAAATFSIGIASWFLLESLPFLPPPPGSNDVGAGAVPALAAALLAVAGLVVAVRKSTAPDDVEVNEPVRVLGTLVLLLAFVLGLASSLNAWAVIAGFIVALQLTLGERRWTWLLFGTGLLLLAIWFLFGRILAVPL